MSTNCIPMPTLFLISFFDISRTLAGLQFDALQYQRNHIEGVAGVPSNMPRIIELADFGQLGRKNASSSFSVGSLEMLSMILLSLCCIGAALAGICFLCLRQKR